MGKIFQEVLKSTFSLVLWNNKYYATLSTFEYFLEKMLHTNKKKTLNLYSYKIWSIWLHCQIQGPNLKCGTMTSNYTYSTELKSNSPLKIMTLNAFKNVWCHFSCPNLSFRFFFWYFWQRNNLLTRTVFQLRFFLLTQIKQIVQLKPFSWQLQRFLVWENLKKI